jgi:hypothetical protein
MDVGGSVSIELSSSGGSAYLYRSSETKIRQLGGLVWVIQAAFASRYLKGPLGRVVEVRTGTAQRCQDPPIKNYGGKCRLVDLLMKMCTLQMTQPDLFFLPSQIF